MNRMMLKHAEMNYKIAECNLKILRSSHSDRKQIETAEKIVKMTKDVLTELRSESMIIMSDGTYTHHHFHHHHLHGIQDMNRS